MWNDFRKFVMRGNVIDLAVGIIVGSAFTAIVRSLVDDLLMPPLGALIGNADFSRLYVTLQAGNPAPPYASLAAAQEAGAVTLNYGQFLNNVVSFLIVAAATFFLVRGIASLQRHEEKAPAAPATKTCPYCRSVIAAEATRCPHCTSQLAPAGTETAG